VVDQVASNQVVISRASLLTVLRCVVMRACTFKYSSHLQCSLAFFFTRVFGELGTTILFRHIVHRPHNMFRLPSGMLDKPNKVQRVQGAHEPRLHMHLPLFLLAVPLSLISSWCQVTPLGLDDLRE